MTSAARMPRSAPRHVCDDLVEFLEHYASSQELPVREHTEVNGVTRLANGEFLVDTPAAGVSTVIWCVGFGGDFSRIHHDVLGDRGLPIHDAGVSPVKGLYHVGFPWLSKRKSGILLGVSEDAGRVVEEITAGI